MESMFTDCDEFVGTGLDNWDTENVAIMSNMFSGCDAIVKLPRWYTDVLDSGNDSKDEAYWMLIILLLWSIAIVIPVIAYIVFEK